MGVYDAQLLFPTSVLHLRRAQWSKRITISKEYVSRLFVLLHRRVVGLVSNLLSTMEYIPAKEDEPTPPEPFEFVSDSVVAQEEVPSPEPIPEPSPTPVPEDTMLAEDTQPSEPVLEHEQLTIQDSSATPILDLNEDQPLED
ncbi:hypothetical protein JHK87_055251 [Glycine soja]|nr:hypothetical protein JHK87_055251 [Glycine soja]